MGNRLRNGLDVSRPNSLAGRVFIAQLVVLTITFVALLATILLVAPGLFMYHLEMTGEDSPLVQLHAQQALERPSESALLAAAAVAVLVAVLLLVRRSQVSRPIEDLADAAVQVAAGGRQITVPDNGFSRGWRTCPSLQGDGRGPGQHRPGPCQAPDGSRS